VERSGGSAKPALCIIGRCDLELWGLSTMERARRLFARLGLTETISEEALPSSDGAVVLVRADYVIEESVAATLTATPDTVLTVTNPGAAGPVAFAANLSATVSAEDRRAVAALLRGEAGASAPGGVAVRDYAAIAPRYNYELRKHEQPYVLPLRSESLDEVERRTFAGAYKGVTDAVTKYVWPTPALWATRWAARRRITPNMVTTVGLIFVLLALVLFAKGQFWAGLAAAWLMTFLDTVDGKLARVTFTASTWGGYYDHATDMIHPPLWWAAWWYAIRDGADPSLLPVLDLSGYVVIGGYVAGRLIELGFKQLYRIRIHVWEPIDSAFRLITARRNPNLVILTASMLLGAPALGFVAVAIWTAVSLLFHAVRFIQGGLLHRRGERLVSWLDEPAGRVSRPADPAPRAAQ